MLKLEEEQPKTSESAQSLAPYSELVPSVELEPVMAKEASIIEIRIAKRLTDLNIGFEYHKSFAAPPTTPTFYFPRKNIAIYLERITTTDAKKTREDLVRGIWERLYNGKAMTIQYKAQTRGEEAKAWSQVAEALSIKARGAP